MHIPRQMAARLCGWLLASAAGMSGASGDRPAYATCGDPALAGLLAESLERNPALRRAALESEAARQLVPQAGALPDPRLSLSARDAAPGQRGAIAVSQAIPWFGRRAERAGVALGRAGERDATFAVRRAELIRAVKSEYYELAYLDRAGSLAAREEELLRLHESLAQARYSQGAGEQRPVVRLQAGITRALARRNGIAQRRAEVAARLNSLRDLPQHAALPQARLAPRPAVRLDEARLQRLARRHRPEILRASFAVRSEQAALRLARRAHWPDLALGLAWGPGAAHHGLARGGDVLSVSVGFDMPLRRARYRAGQREAEARLAAARQARRGALGEAGAAVRAASARIEMSGERIALFERALVPQSRQALRSAEAAYSAGTAGVLELLDSEEALLESQLGLARLESDYMQALADMERAVGIAFPERGP